MNPYLTFCIASYAAFVSTLVLIWDITKWKANRPRLKIGYSARENVTYTSTMLGRTDRFAENCSSVRVTNVGSQTTTIKSIVLSPSPWKRTKRSEAIQLIFNTLGDKLPSAIEAGKQWQGHINENANNPFINQKHPIFYLHVFHSMSEEPTSTRFEAINLI